MVFFSSSRGGYGFGPMPGFSKKKKSTLGRGNWDRDPKPNRTDCEPFNFKKQEGGSVFVEHKVLSDEDMEDIFDSDEDPADFF